MRQHKCQMLWQQLVPHVLNRLDLFRVTEAARMFPKSDCTWLCWKLFCCSSESLFIKKWKRHTFRPGKRFWWGESYEKIRFFNHKSKRYLWSFIEHKIMWGWEIESWDITFYLGLWFQDSLGLVCGFAGLNIYISFSAEDLTDQWGAKVLGYWVSYRSQKPQPRRWASAGPVVQQPGSISRPVGLLPPPARGCCLREAGISPFLTWKGKVKSSGLVGSKRKQDKHTQCSTWMTLTALVQICHSRTGVSLLAELNHWGLHLVASQRIKGR